MTDDESDQNDLIQLDQVYADIDQRVFAIVGEQPSWPCRKGCDTCCRELAQVPELTQAEWTVLRQDFLLLDVWIQTAIATRIRALSRHQEGKLTCPFLDESHGACHVYHGRPAACRTYGFYMSHYDNRWCDLIQSQYETGDYAHVVFGNHNAIEGELKQRFGDTKSIVDWFEQTGVD